MQEDECNAGTYYAFGTAIWIDYDQSGSFELSERVFAEPFTLAGPRAIVGSFVVPNTATLGVTRMRITVSENEIGTNISLQFRFVFLRRNGRLSGHYHGST
ncbi:MAG: hypothetical protein IPP33_00520 [Flavobacteriales bacterium]|nr:hypothetical protein [Flavobacteriales bacterium]